MLFDPRRASSPFRESPLWGAVVIVLCVMLYGVAPLIYGTFLILAAARAGRGRKAWAIVAIVLAGLEIAGGLLMGLVFLLMVGLNLIDPSSAMRTAMLCAGAVGCAIALIVAMMGLFTILGLLPLRSYPR